MLLSWIVFSLFACYASTSELREKKEFLLKKYGVNSQGFCQEYFLGNTLIEAAQCKGSEFGRWIDLLPEVVADLNPFHLLMLLDRIVEFRLVTPKKWKAIDWALQRDYVWLVTLASVMYKDYGMSFSNDFKQMIVKEERKFLFDHQPGDNGKECYEMRCRQKQYVVRFERWNKRLGVFTSIYFWKDKILSWREIFWAQRLQHVKRYWKDSTNRLEIDARKFDDYEMHGKIGYNIKYEYKLNLKQVQEFVDNEEGDFEAVGQWEVNGICLIKGMIKNFHPILENSICKNLENGNIFYLNSYKGDLIGMDLEKNEIFPFAGIDFPSLQKGLSFGCKQGKDSVIEFGISYKDVLYQRYKLVGASIVFSGLEASLNLDLNYSFGKEHMISLYEMSHILLIKEGTGFALFKAKENQITKKESFFQIKVQSGWRFQNQSGSEFIPIPENEILAFNLSIDQEKHDVEIEQLQEHFLQLI
jgi:hypothetical protein